MHLAAGYAAIALENARLFSEVESERTKLATVLAGDATDAQLAAHTGTDDAVADSSS